MMLVLVYCCCICMITYHDGLLTANITTTANITSISAVGAVATSGDAGGVIAGAGGSLLLPPQLLLPMPRFHSLVAQLLSLFVACCHNSSHF
jgi:hypothetical protein